MPSKKYALPECLVGKVDPDLYVGWLSHKAQAHVKRDRKRGNATAMREAYMKSIHAAVIACGGRDSYTGEELAWELISTYDNEKSKLNKRAYKKSLWMLPTVDHVGDGLGEADFKICSWRTNDCKNDLSSPELLDFCRAVIAYHETQGERRQPNSKCSRRATASRYFQLARPCPRFLAADGQVRSAAEQLMANMAKLFVLASLVWLMKW